MIETKHYDAGFYLDQQNGSYLSAQGILPVVASVFRPASVIDVGCGVGYWLKVWKENLGVKDIMGVEGPYVKPDMLKVDREYIHFKDLKEPLNVNRKFDLAMSLEVAEHLPESSADNFIQSLTSLSNVVLFSAAIIGQGGTYHINEQMPEYWSSKFEKHGFVPVDYVRPLIWNKKEVDWWYKQNIILFIRKESIANYPELKTAYENTDPENLLIVHPALYKEKQQVLDKTKTWIGYTRWRLYLLKKSFKKQFNKKGV